VAYGGKEMDKKPVSVDALYSSISENRVNEANLRWQGAQVAVILNLPAIGAAIAQVVVESSLKQLAFILIGSVLCIFVNRSFLKIMIRNGQHMHFWNECLAELESLNGTEGNTKVFSSEKFKKLSKSHESLQYRLQRVSRGYIITWSLIGMIAFGKIFGGMAS
jgi:hypothetical protein